MKANNLNWATPIGRNSNGRFVSLKDNAISEGVKIIVALYGVDTNRIDIRDNIVIGKKVGNKMAGSDPCPKLRKNLLVTALVNGVEVEREFAEGEKLVF